MRIRMFLCKIGIHVWRHEQECFLTDTFHGPNPYKKEVVIAWKQCKECAKSKLIHILK